MNTYKITYVEHPEADEQEIFVQANNNSEAYVNACIKLGPNYGPIGGNGAILDVILVEN
jgi:hypothetical protein